jgi:hypothetical protein
MAAFEKHLAIYWRRTNCHPYILCRTVEKKLLNARNAIEGMLWRWKPIRRSILETIRNCSFHRQRLVRRTKTNE